MVYHLAIDIGASGGRHILGYIENGKLKLEEIYRFENGITEMDGRLIWDIDNLVFQVKTGIRKCREIGKIPVSVAIDTWGVDYVLLDGNKREILPAVAYRDGKTEKIIPEFEKIITKEEFYHRNGIQPLTFNTIYQLFRDKLEGKLEKAKYFLMMPDYLAFKLTGVIKNEYTNATTGAIVSARNNKIDTEIFSKLGIASDIFGELSMPCEAVGEFSDETREFVGFNSTVVLCPTHDTASAVAACPLGENGLYISSGTWSLIGTENTAPILETKALSSGFTNEGGINYSFRFLKNIMGMWLFQNIRRDLGKRYTYDEMMNLAINSSYKKRFNPNHKSLTAPENMIKAIEALLGDGELPIGDLLSAVYHSLAYSYKEAVETVESICGKTIDRIMIVGGGSKDKYLNKLTSEYTGKKVFIGLSEATATGNLLSQLMYWDKALTLEKGRELIQKSFDITEV